jgi:hypothetical protein
VSFNIDPLGLVISLVQFISNVDKSRESTVVVEAYGANDEEARKNGFSLATQYVSGENILTERRVGATVQNTTIQYSSGYVSDFKINDRREENNKVILTMEVKIKQLKLQDRLVNYPTNQSDFEGEKIYAQIDTSKKQQTNGAALLDKVLADFPSQAFKVNYNTAVVKNYSDFKLNVVAQLQWNPEYINSINQAIDITGEGGSWYGPVVNDRHIRDLHRYHRIRNKMIYLNLEATIFDENDVPVIRQCGPFNHKLVKFYKDELVMDRSRTETVDFNIKINNIENVKRGRRIDVRAVEKCMRNI